MQADVFARSCLEFGATASVEVDLDEHQLLLVGHREVEDATRFVAMDSP